MFDVDHAPHEYSIVASGTNFVERIIFCITLELTSRFEINVASPIFERGRMTKATKERNCRYFCTNLILERSRQQPILFRKRQPRERKKKQEQKKRKKRHAFVTLLGRG